MDMYVRTFQRNMLYPFSLLNEATRFSETLISTSSYGLAAEKANRPTDEII